VSALTEHLGRLEAWLRRNGDAPAWWSVRIVESAEIKYGLTDEIPQRAMKTAESYAPRFERLLAAGYAWINLSALGVLGEHLLVCVELPREPVGILAGRTSVNLSGPPLDARTRACIWDASVRFRLID
jgi:hypothetical protein